MKRQTFRALLGAALVLGAVGRSAASPYTITVLDGNGGSLTFPMFLNNLGQVAGTWNQYSGPHGAGGDHPFLYDPTAGGMVTLPGIISPSGQDPGRYGFQGSISGLNDLGQAVGSRNDGTFLRDSTTGQMTSLPGPAGLITNSGQVIGTQQVAPVGGWANFHPYSYQNGTLQDLGVPPGAVGAQVQAVNNLGQVLVQAAMTPGGFTHSFLFSGGKWTDLGNFYGAAINDQGTIAGNTGYVTGQPTHAAVIPPGGAPIDVGTLPGDTFSSAYGINNHGQVVGLSFKQNSTDLYQGGGRLKSWWKICTGRGSRADRPQPKSRPRLVTGRPGSAGTGDSREFDHMFRFLGPGPGRSGVFPGKSWAVDICPTN